MKELYMKEINMVINKFLIKIIVLFFFNFLIFQTSTQSLENKILYKVDNKIITSIDIKEEINYLTVLNPSLKELSKIEIEEISKKSLINEKIKEIEILKNFENPEVPNEILEQFIKNIYFNIGFSNLSEFQNYLKSNQVDFNEVKSKIQIEVLWNELIVYKFSNKLKIDEEKIRDKVKNNFNKKSKSYLLSEILFEVSKDENLNEKYIMISKSISDTGFNNTALIYSISESANIGGKLGWIDGKSLNEKISNELISLKNKEITKPIRVPGGFLILQVNDTKFIKNNDDIEKEISKTIKVSQNNQYKQFSKLYFNRIKKNMEINEI